jgi:F1F0 ATPase subunit 2
MTMSDYVSLALALLAGAALGGFFFGGLWLTVRKMESMRNPTLLLLASFLGRTLITLAGFFLIAGGRWERLMVAVVGFVIVRLVLIRVGFKSPTKPPDEEVEARAIKS